MHANSELAKVSDAPIELSETGLLIQQAQEKGLDAEKLYEIYAEERRDRRKMAFTRAFAAFQSEVPPTVRKSAKQITDNGIAVPYATITDIREHVDPYLRANGLALSYGNKEVGGQMYETVKLMHVDGHEEERMVPFKADKPSKAMNDVQAIGSGQTYGMRYATIAILGLWFVDPDDDGKKAGGTKTPKTITDDQARTVNDLLIEANANRETFLKYFGVAAVAELTTAQFDRACTMLNKKIAEARKA